MATILELSNENLYAYNANMIVMEDDGSEELERKTLPYVFSNQDKTYTIKEGDTIDKIAFEQYSGKVLNPEKYWFYIADVNATVIENPLDLSELVGKMIIIPDVLLLGL